MTRLRVATWNVHEGIPADGATLDDPSVFWAPLVAAEADVAALQEVLFPAPGELGDLPLVAKFAGMPHIASFPLSTSSTRAGALAGLALLSRYPLHDERRSKLPNPRLRHEGDGCVLSSHDKGLLEAVLDHNGHSVRMISLHALPFHRFGRIPQDFESIWAALAKSLGPLDSLPLLVGGDFNTDQRELLTERVDGRLHQAIGDRKTHLGRSTDDILYTDAFGLVTSEVIRTRSDHALCLAELELARPVASAVLEFSSTGAHNDRGHPRGHPMA